MEPMLEMLPYRATSSIVVKREDVPHMMYPWHYHPEFEIIYVEKSYGIRLMGDNIDHFSDGDLMFVSPYLPHVWRNHNDFYQGNKDLMVKVYVIHFKEDALGPKFFDLPEFNHIKQLFKRGQQGVLITGESRRHISNLIEKVYRSSGIDRLVFLIKTLDALAGAEDYKLLSSQAYTHSINDLDAERISMVMNYIMKNYQKQINLDKIAEMVKLSKSSFCRYFKQRTRKTFTQFLNEIRIGHACKLLVAGNMTVSEICYDTGYNNISHFNRQFKLITGMTAKKYSQEYISSAIKNNQDLPAEIEIPETSLSYTF